jgi:flagellar biogenesis protein FliO
MKVLERISLGQDKSIVLVMVGKKAYLLGVSAKGIDALRDFNEGEFTMPQQDNFQKTDFSILFNDISKKCSGFGSDIGQSLNGALKDFIIKNGRNGL